MKPPTIRVLPFRRFHTGNRRLAPQFPSPKWEPCTVPLSFDLYNEGACKTDPKACKPPVIFIHGFFGSKTNNRSISKRLSHDLSRPIYAIDLRNHGHSPHDKTHTYEALAADIRGFITEHSIQKPTLIGHSMGAKAAMTLALWQPHMVQNLIAVDNAPVDAALKSDFHSYVAGMREVARKGVTKQSEADEILKPYAPELPVRQFLLTNLVRKKDDPSQLQWRIPLETLARQLNGMGDFPFRDPEQAQYKGPTLIVRGTKSPYVADEALPVIGRFFPRFELADIEAGHWVISENMEAFRQAVVRFMEDKD